MKKILRLFAWPVTDYRVAAIYAARDYSRAQRSAA